MAGTNLLWAYSLGWRTLTTLQAQALLHAFEFMGGDVEGMNFLEWPNTPASNVVIGTGTGSGSLAFAVHGLLYGGTVAASGLVITRNGTPLTYPTDFTLGTSSGVNYTEHVVTIAAAANVNGATYRASWTSGRRRRNVRLEDGASWKLRERPADSLRRWTGSAALIETAASD